MVLSPTLFDTDGAGVYGPSNADGASLESTMIAAAGSDYVRTPDDPIMHRVTIDHVLWVSGKAWGQYVAFMVKRETASPAALGHDDSIPRGEGP